MRRGDARWDETFWEQDAFGKDVKQLHELSLKKTRVTVLARLN